MSDNWKIIIPGELPTLNEIIDEAKRGNYRYQPYNTMKKEHTQDIAWLAIAKIGKPLSKIDINITWICKNKRKDKDNIAAGVKFILDALVEAKIIKNDGWKHIGDINHSFKVDKNNPRVEVSIKEVS